MTTLWVVAAVAINTAASGVEIRTIPDTPLFVDRDQCLKYLGESGAGQTACLLVWVSNKPLSSDKHNGSFESNVLLEIGVPRSTKK